jgi:hypothetical protein
MKGEHCQEGQTASRANLNHDLPSHQPGGPGVTKKERELEIEHCSQPGAGGAAKERQELLAQQRLDGKGEKRSKRHGSDD